MHTHESLSNIVSFGVRGVHTGIPSYFKAWCWNATRGGNSGYEQVGFQLARTVEKEIPHDIDSGDWTDEIDKLNDALADKNREKTMHWFEQHYPRMMKLIPTARRERFINGVERAWEDGLIGL